jgi:hypothetical protein
MSFIRREIASVIRGTAHPDRNHADGGQHMGIARRHPPALYWLRGDFKHHLPIVRWGEAP